VLIFYFSLEFRVVFDFFSVFFHPVFCLGKVLKEKMGYFIIFFCVGKGVRMRLDSVARRLLIVLLILFFCSTGFAVTFTQTYQAQTLLPNYFNSYYITGNSLSDYWSVYGGLDWNTYDPSDWNHPHRSWTKVDNSIPAASNTTGTNGRMPLGEMQMGDAGNAHRGKALYDPLDSNAQRRYKMYYSGYTNPTNFFHPGSAGSVSRIFMATSPDGLTWEKYDSSIIKVRGEPEVTSNTTQPPGKIVRGTGTNDRADDYYTYIGSVIINDQNRYIMYYSGHDGSYWRGLAADSNDGINWVKRKNDWGTTSPLTIPTTNSNDNNFGAIMMGGAQRGDSLGVLGPQVIFDANDSNVLQRYKMWYGGYYYDNCAATGNWAEKIFYATSADGNTWVKYDNNCRTNGQNKDQNSWAGRIFPGSWSTSGDDYGVIFPVVLKDGNMYKMWYAGRISVSPADDRWRIYYAYSYDGNVWTKYDNNTPANTDTSSTNGRLGLGTSDAKGDSQGVIPDSVIKDANGTYYMWYSGLRSSTRLLGSTYNQWGEFLATSNDGGLTWTKADNSIPDDSDTDSNNGRLAIGKQTRGDYISTYTPRVIKDGNLYKMWYTGQNGVRYSGSQYNDEIYYATSPDGLTWTKYDNSHFELPPSNSTGSNGRLPIGVVGTADEYILQCPFVIKDGNHTHSTEPATHVYRMWYSGWSSSGSALQDGWRILYAYSNDGLTWTKYDNSFVSPSDTTSTRGRQTVGTTGTGDAAGVSCPSIVKEDQNFYRMYYHGSNGSNWQIFYAYSYDGGFTWTKYDNTNPTSSDYNGTNGRIPLGSSSYADGSEVTFPYVIKDDNESNPNYRYKMWYSGWDGTTTPQYLFYTLYATSPDGLTWTKHSVPRLSGINDNSANFGLMRGSANKGDYYRAYQPSVLIDDDGTYKLWYYGLDVNSIARIYHAQYAPTDNWDENLQAYYDFDEFYNGTYLRDKARAVNSYIYDYFTLQEGLWGTKSGYFQGGRIYQSYSKNIHFIKTNFSTEFWFKAAGCADHIFNRYSSVTTPFYYSYGVRLCTGSAPNMGFSLWKQDQNKITDYNVSGVNAVDSEWHHAALVFKDTNVSLYVDGNHVYTYTSYDPVNNPVGQFAGSYIYSPAYLDELKFWSKPLTAEDINATYWAGRDGKFASQTIDAVVPRSFGTVKVNTNTPFSFNKEISLSELTSVVYDSNELQSTNPLFDANLVGLWHLNDANSDGYVLDATDNNIDGLLKYGATVNGVGLWDKNAASFNGTTAKIDFNKADILSGSSGATWSAWVKPYNLSSAVQSYHSIITSWNDTNSYTWWFGLRSGWSGGSFGGMTLMVRTNGSIGYTPEYTNPLLGLRTGKWQHVVATFDGTKDNKAVKFFIDGVKVQEFDKYTLGNTIGQGTTDALQIGADRNVTSPFNGLIDEVAVWKRPLTETEVQSLYNSQKEEFKDANLIGLWHFNDVNQKSGAVDSSANDYSGTPISESLVTFNPTGKVNRGVSLTGAATSYISLPNMGDFNEFTYCGWANITANVSWAGPFGYRGTTVRGFQFVSANSAAFQPELVTSVNNVEDSNRYCLLSSQATGSWRHYCWTRSATNVKLYVNGTDTAITTSGCGSGYPQTQYALGRGYASINGSIDEVNIWKRVLTSDEISYIYNSSSGRSLDPSATFPVTGNPVDLNLAAIWHLDENRWGQPTADSSGNGRDLNMYALRKTSGLWDTNAGLFDGLNRYVVANDSSALKPADAITLSSWFKTSNPAAAQRIISKIEGGGYGITLNTDSTYCSATGLCFLMYAGGAYNGTYTSSTRIKANQWYNVVGTYDKDVMKIYLDGVLVGWNNIANNPITYSGTNPLCIGSESTATDCQGGSNFSGTIEETAMWGRALSELEVKELYRKGATRLDLNVYSCSDAACNTKLGSDYLENVDNNTTISITGVGNGRYFGYDAYFRKANGIDSNTSGITGVSSYLQDITVDTQTANLSPETTITDIENNIADGNVYTYSYFQDGNLDINFTVFDLTNDRLLATISYSSSSTALRADANVLILDRNLDEAICTPIDWNATTAECTLSTPINALSIPDGNWYFILDLNDLVNARAYSVSPLIRIDNTGPTITRQSPPVGWERNQVDITLTCNDTISDCNSSTLRYKIDDGAWAEYSGEFRIKGDGNRVIYVDGNDEKGNYSGVQEFNVLVGYNGKLRTYTDQNIPEHVFGAGQRVQFVYDVNLATAPTIYIYTPSGALAESGDMSDVTGDSAFGTNGLNTYYYSMNLGDTNGWYRAVVQNQEFEKTIYLANGWVDRYTDNEGGLYSFTRDINVTNTAGENRWYTIVDKWIDFNYAGSKESLRLLDYNGTAYREVPVQAYAETYSGARITGARIVFLTSIGALSTKSYVLTYSTSDANREYLTDLNLMHAGDLVDINNSNYSTTIDFALGGAIRKTKSKIGSYEELNGFYPQQTAPTAKNGSQYYSINSETTPTYTIKEGPLLDLIRVSGTVKIGALSFYDYNLLYKFYSKSNYYLLDKNITFISPLDINYYEDYTNYSTQAFRRFYSDSEPVVIELSNAGAQSSSANPTEYGLYDERTLNAYGKILLSQNSNLAITNTLDFNDGANYSQTINKLFALTVSPSDYINTQTAEVIFNPLLLEDDLNNTKEILQSPLMLSLADTETNDSSVPTLISSSSTPTDANNAYAVICSSEWSDDTIIERITLQVIGPDINLFESETKRTQTATMEYTINASNLTGGDVNCIFTAYDIADNITQVGEELFVTDVAAPRIITVANMPDTNSLIDPGTSVRVDTNISEFTGLADVNLNYRRYDDVNASWGDWNEFAMNYDTNYSQTGYSYYTEIVLEEGTYEYYITAADLNANTTDSNTYKLYAYTDRTWAISPTSFPVTYGNLGMQVTLGNLIIENTGDLDSNFKIISDWEDKEAILFDSTAEGLAGVEVTLLAGEIKTIPVLVTAKSIERSDEITIRVQGLHDDSKPSDANITATLISYSNGPFLYVQWVAKDIAVQQGDTNVYYSIKITNMGNQDTNNLVVDWNYPTGFTITSGTAQYVSSGTFATLDSVTIPITFTVSSSAIVGDNDFSVKASCADPDKNQTKAITVSVVAAGTGGNTNNPPGGGTLGAGTGATGGGASPLQTEQQKALFFQTTQFFELVRGSDDSFQIKVTNPLDGNMIDINLSVSGIMAKYLELENTHIDVLDTNQEFETRIKIASPKYFNPGEYQISFVISAVLDKGYYNKRAFTETRIITLLIHDTNKESAQAYIEDIQQFITDLNAQGLKLNDLPRMIADSNILLDKRSYDDIATMYAAAKQTYEQALDAKSASQKLSGLMDTATGSGIDTPNTKRIVKLAGLAIKRGEYALALDRLKEAELTYGLETKGEFNAVFFIWQHRVEVIIALVILIVFSYILWMWIKLMLVKKKLGDYTKENKLLLDLIKNLQNKCFVENKISLGEYYDALNQFETRIAEVSEGIIEMESKKLALFNFSSPVTRLEKERERLLTFIRSTQKEYFELGLIETKIYKTKMDSMTKRLSEVEEAIVMSELLQTARVTRGLAKPIWRAYYSIMR
jgi:uncharacterized membrane protein